MDSRSVNTNNIESVEWYSIDESASSFKMKNKYRNWLRPTFNFPLNRQRPVFIETVDETVYDEECIEW